MPRIWEVPKIQLDRFQRQERRWKTHVSVGVTTQFYGNHYHIFEYKQLHELSQRKLRTVRIG